MGERYLTEVRLYATDQALPGLVEPAVFAVGFSPTHPLRDRVQRPVAEWVFVSGWFAIPDVPGELRVSGGAAWLSATGRDMGSIPRPRHLFAGATLAEAACFVESWEGRIYLPIAHQRRARRMSALWKRQYALQRRLTREASEQASYWHRRAVAADRVVWAARTLFLIDHPAANPLAIDELRAALVAAGVLSPVDTPVDTPMRAFGTTPKATYSPDAWDGDR